MSIAANYAVGSLVSARGREWVVLPSDDPALLMLRPLGGTEADASGLLLDLEGDDVRTATFEPPDPNRPGDHASARLLRDAVRLSFRAGAGPFRSLGRIAVEPRSYQLVPLLMALKLDPVRLLIADDVGIGKTVEAALIARELLDRGEIHRLAVLCPPHLCDQWQAELSSKFHIEAEVVRPGTVARLERGISSGTSLFDIYPFVVVSIDYIKSDRRRDDFVRACPEFVIVDEAHTCAAGVSQSGGQHQRHRLVRDLARDDKRHLVLTTATPHSGVESAFRSLLTLLNPRFADLPFDQQIAADDPLRRKLAEHFVQRRRGDIKAFGEENTPFPVREATELTWTMSREYRALFDQVHAYANELVQGSFALSAFKRRICWWAALALLRCVASSPAAAAATLRTRAGGVNEEANLSEAALDALAGRAVLDLETSDAAEQDDVVPGADTIEGDGPDTGERARLLRMARSAEALAGDNDRKLTTLVPIVKKLLDDGFSPIVFCRYIATADYVAAELKQRLRGVTVDAVTGLLPSEDRKARVEALARIESRVLVATDCLSEGINLQEGFDAVIHYDLSWNPTRHEQREGRVDRFGQAKPVVRTLLYFGEDNQVDGAIMKVLLRKAESIRKQLGVSVPVPSDSTKVLEAVFESLFLSKASPQQMQLDFNDAELRLKAVEAEWERAEERERKSRTIFAQHAIHPDAVRAELDEATRALGGSGDVERFVRAASALLGAPIGNERGRAVLSPTGLPAPVRERLPFETSQKITFTYPVPEGARYIGRTGPVVETFASYLVDTALDPTLTGPAARAGAIRTTAVTTRTTLLLVRIRMHLESTHGGETRELLAEEAVVVGYRGRADRAEWLTAEEAEALLAAEPAANMADGEKTMFLQQALDDLQLHQHAGLEALALQRAEQVLAAHRRVRRAAQQTGVNDRVRPSLPVDLLGVYLLIPAPGGSH
jgi:superfamily II DNA or RNA helicase